MDSSKSKALSHYILIVAAIVSVFCLAATFFVPEIKQQTGAFRFLLRFNLGTENNLGAWWSGILLLLASVYAFDGYFAYKDRDASAGYGWITLSVILFLLSIDEIGSLHERILVGNSWLAVLPFALVLVAGITYVIRSLWRNAEQRKIVFWIALGFCVLATVPVQEELGDRFQSWGDYRSVRIMLEEGTELFAILILLKASMSSSYSVHRNGFAPPVFQVLTVYHKYLLITALIAAPVFAYMTALLTDHFRGHPADWLAAGGFLFAGLVIARRFFEPGNNDGWSHWVLATTCLILSAVSVAYSAIGAPEKKFMILCLLSFSICAIWIYLARHSKAMCLTAFMFMFTLTVVSFFQHSVFFTYLLYAVMSLLVYFGNTYLVASIDRHRESVSLTNTSVTQVLS